METIKAYTDIEQSKKLAEILPFESADMVYIWHATSDNPAFRFDDDMPPMVLKDVPINEITADTLPCWSLAALLQVLPLGVYDKLDSCDYELEINMIDKMPRYVRLGDIYHSQFPYDFEKDTLLDNIVESIIWLNDNNYFEL